MRKMLLALVAFFVMAGLVVAAEFTITKVDKDTVTVKDGDKEVTIKLTDKTKFTTTDGKGENSKEAKREDFDKRTAKIGKNGFKVEGKVEKEVFTEITWKTKGK